MAIKTASGVAECRSALPNRLTDVMQNGHAMSRVRGRPEVVSLDRLRWKWRPKEEDWGISVCGWASYTAECRSEKLLFEAFAARRQFDLLDDRSHLRITPGRDAEQYAGYDVIAERCINHSRALYSLRMLNDRGIATVNTAQVADVCGNKLQTTSALTAAGIPSPRTLIAYSSDSALRAIESLGYPVVLKPAVGYWGRQLSNVNDREAAE